jgi:hypothetical protein
VQPALPTRLSMEASQPLRVLDQLVLHFNIKENTITEAFASLHFDIFTITAQITAIP